MGRIGFVVHSVGMGQITHYRIHIGERGRLVLPAELRKRLDLKLGDLVIASIRDDDPEVRLVSARELARRLAGMYRDLAPGRSLSEELIAERHAEAERESSE